MLTAIVHCTLSHQKIPLTRRIKHFASIISLPLHDLPNACLRAILPERETHRALLTIFRFGPSSVKTTSRLNVSSSSSCLIKLNALAQEWPPRYGYAGVLGSSPDCADPYRTRSRPRNLQRPAAPP